MISKEKIQNSSRRPAWLRMRVPTGPAFDQMASLLKKASIQTVCEEAHCPNLCECFPRGTASFLIMGSRCTRHCSFCAVDHGPLKPLDPEEPGRVAKAVQSLGLSYVVVTSVTRDDLSDGGASCFSATISAIRETCPGVRVEVLIPDFQGDADALKTVVLAEPDVLGHNIETVPSLYPEVRPGAEYERSLALLRRSKHFNPSIPVKSGLMLGFGESSQEVRQTLQDIADTGCSMLTIGQYLRPSFEHLPEKRYPTPEEFDNWKAIAFEMGFEKVSSAPIVRSSYRARELYESVPFRR